ncbi:MAG: hypothetical protein K2K74_08560, partial [Lachnospiraceae bacterium]|nr:hypothetical protein [Lachnospiraceae bacterium]
MSWEDQSIEVTVTVPSAEIADAVMGCGSTTGRSTDKVSKFGIELASVERSRCTAARQRRRSFRGTATRSFA